MSTVNKKICKYSIQNMKQIKLKKYEIKLNHSPAAKAINSILVQYIVSFHGDLSLGEW